MIRFSSSRTFGVFIVFAFNSVFGLKCYQCQLEDGVGDSGCGEHPPPEKYLRDCAQPQCWMRFSSNGTLHVERFCVAYATNINGCNATMVEDKRGMQHTGIECKCSNSDGCNGYSPNIINIHANRSNSNNHDGNNNNNYNNHNHNHHNHHNHNRNNDYGEYS